MILRCCLLFLFLCSCASPSREVRTDKGGDRNEKLVAISSAVPTLELSGESESFEWVENKLNWPIIKAKSSYGEVLVFIDSGSGLTAVRENSNFARALETSSRVDINGFGSLGLIQTLEIGNVKIKNLGVHVFEHAADSTKELRFPCCDILLGQNALQSVDVLFNKVKKRIQFFVPKEKKFTSYFRVWHQPELGNNWFAKVKINDQSCEAARIDTGAAYQLKIYEPWYKSNKKMSYDLEIGDQKFRVVPRFQKSAEVAVNEKVCANIGIEALFLKPFYLSYRYRYGAWIDQ